jgi:hypothetical protein
METPPRDFPHVRTSWQAPVAGPLWEDTVLAG